MLYSDWTWESRVYRFSFIWWRWHYKVNPTWAGPFWKYQGCGRGRLVGLRWKKHAVVQNIFVHFAWNFVHILYWQCGISLDKKIWQMSLLSSFDDVIMKVNCWRLVSFLGINVFLLVNWVCKIHKQTDNYFAI